LFSSSYGYGVYKRNQVTIGNPYEVKLKEPKPKVVEVYDEAAATTEEVDSDLIISQDIIYKAKEEAALLRREAELAAERILEQAQEKVKVLYEEWEQKAREEGYRQGEMLAQQDYNDLLAEAQAFKERCKAEYEATMAALESDIVHLVLDIATRVVGDEIKNNEQAILGVVRQTLEVCASREHIVLRVSPEDYEVVLANEEKLRSMVKDLDTLEVKKDGSLTKGSCIIDTGFGSVDGSADTRLESIRKAFFDLLQEE
jgi:flagellar assembly protein FliH